MAKIKDAMPEPVYTIREEVDGIAADGGTPASLEAAGEIDEILAKAIVELRARMEAEVTEEEVEAFSESYKDQPLEDLSEGRWHPSEPAAVAWALSLLAQEVTGLGGVLATTEDLAALEKRLAGSSRATVAASRERSMIRSEYEELLEALGAASGHLHGWSNTIEHDLGGYTDRCDYAEIRSHIADAIRLVVELTEGALGVERKQAVA